MWYTVCNMASTRWDGKARSIAMKAIRANRYWTNGLKSATDDEYRERILSKVKKTKRGCWEWQAGIAKHFGYGAFWYRGKTHEVHRVAYLLFKGPITDGLWVLHKCDNPPCCNPDHLYLGKPKNNSEDMVNRGRAATGKKNGRHTHPETTARGNRSGSRLHPESLRRGSDHPGSKLTEKIVRVIRSMYRSGLYSQQAIANKFEINQTMVGFIVRRKVWTHI